MSSKTLSIRQQGIFHNLPTFNHSIQGKVALVAGATGISGWSTIRVLLESPARWSKVYALSRSPPSKELLGMLTSDQESRLKHVSVDLLQSPTEIAKSLKEANVQCTHVFCYAYLQPKVKSGAAIWSNAQELVDINKKIFDNLIDALPAANITPSRFLLQTGAKNYGPHLGRARTPFVESDPQPRHLGPNFYYPQEDKLHEYCKLNQGISWNIIMPGAILGAVSTAQMNMIYSLAVYAAVQAHKKEPLKFPGDWDSWQQELTVSSATLTGYLSEWAILEDDCANQRFNAADGETISWDRILHELARWTGAKGVEGPVEDERAYQTIESAGGEKSPLGQGPPLKMRMSFKFIDWAKDEVNQRAWKDIVDLKNGGLNGDPFAEPDETFGILDAGLMKTPTLSMSKARILGWSGFVDTSESIYRVVSELEQLGLLPKLLAEQDSSTV
jgi:nucleoside-diphosphate-sugar epimerase